MAILTVADPNYRREMGEGLIQRWSTVEDTENIAQLCGFVFRDKEDEPINIHAVVGVRRHMSGNFPLMGPGDYALIEDMRKEGNPLVACIWFLTGDTSRALSRGGYQLTRAMPMRPVPRWSFCNCSSAIAIWMSCAMPSPMCR